MISLFILGLTAWANTEPCRSIAGNYAEARTLVELTVNSDCSFDVRPELETGRYSIRFTSGLRYSSSMLGAWMAYGVMDTEFPCTFPADMVLYPKDQGDILEGYFRYPRFITSRCSFSGGGKQNLLFIRQDKQ